MFKFLKSFNTEITDDITSKKAFSIGTYSVLCFVALIMTILNVLTSKGWLTACTGVFSMLCAVNIILSVFNDKLSSIAKTLFAVEVILMFTFFLISGNPDGFSAIWICMLPSLGMFFFGRTKGTAICVAMFAVLVFCLWSPQGQSILMYNYSETFKMRFPVLFVAFHLLAFLLETLRMNAYKQMKHLQEYYHDLSVRDQLTGMFNRQGMCFTVESDDEYKNAERLGAAIFDIDYFKQVNDTYGHNMGDAVLKEFAEVIKTNLDAVVCRWGGEEFVAIFANSAVTPVDLDRVRRIISERKFSTEKGDFSITVSAGICEADNFDIKDIDRLINNADSALYTAKGSGRNCTVRFKSEDE